MVTGILFISLLFAFLLIPVETINADSILLAGVIGNLIVTVLIWIGCRLIVHVLWYKFPWEKSPIKHLLIEIILIPIWAIFIMELSYRVYGRMFPVQDIAAHINGLVIGLLVTLFITSLHEGVYFYLQWKQHFALSVKLEKDNLEARYETLKAQLNPHFLFNSLNTLITFVEENPKATEYIQNLSDFMRYVLKSREKELTMLSEELEVCKKYLFLQQSRFGNNLTSEITVNENSLKLYVPPLSVQMLIDNAIKHNVVSKEKPLNILIGLENENYLYVTNNLQIKTSEAKNGLGLRNISERYNYLSKSQVVIAENESEFKVILPLLKVNL